MAENAKVKGAQERKREFEDREIEKRRKKDEKKERKKREREETEEDREAGVEGRLRSDGGDQMEEPQDEEMGEINLIEIEDLIGEWVAEIQQVQADECEEGHAAGPPGRLETSMEQARDDVKGGELPSGKVKEARMEEVSFMQGRKLWGSRPIEECMEKLGKPQCR